MDLNSNGSTTCEKIARTSRAKKFSLVYQELGSEACSGRVWLPIDFFDSGVISVDVLIDAFSLFGDISTSWLEEEVVLPRAASPSPSTVSWAAAEPNNAEVMEKSIN